MFQDPGADQPCEGGITEWQGLGSRLNQPRVGAGQAAKPLQASFRPHPVTEVLRQQVRPTPEVEHSLSKRHPPPQQGQSAAMPSPL